MLEGSMRFEESHSKLRRESHWLLSAHLGVVNLPY